MERKLKEIIEKAKNDEDVLAVILFGSYIKRGVKPSDIDICLMLKPKNLTKISMSNKKLEYLSLVPERYDIQIFQQLPTFVRVRILKEGKFLLKKNYRLVFKVALDSIKEFELFKKHYLYCIKRIAYGR
jgi:predicted nucleotidyltransferase